MFLAPIGSSWLLLPPIVSSCLLAAPIVPYWLQMAPIAPLVSYWLLLVPIRSYWLLLALYFATKKPRFPFICYDRFFPGKAVEPGFSLSGWPLALYRLAVLKGRRKRVSQKWWFF